MSRQPDRGSASWAIAAGLALGPAVALGFARFAYGLVLPGMRADLGWSFAEAGTVNTANAVGYLAGAVAATQVNRRLGPRTAFRAGLFVTAVAVLASAATGVFGVVLVLRFVAGLSGAVVFISGATLASGLVRGDAGQSVLGVYLGGAAVGVVVSGFVVPALLDGSGAEGWRLGWLALGGLSVAATGAALSAARRAPVPDAPPASAAGWRARPIAPAMLSYGLFGAGYIAYATFIVAYLRSDDAGTVEIALFWALLGAASLASVFAWGRALAQTRGGRGLAITNGVTAVGAALPLLSDATPMRFASAALFGSAFLAVPTAATAFGRSAYPPHHWTIAISALTVAFALGQCLGPVMAGVLADGQSGIRAGLLLSAVILAAGALVALAQREQLDRSGGEQGAGAA